MVQDKNEEAAEAHLYVPPVWMEELVRASASPREQTEATSQQFQQRCREASEEARLRSLMRQEKQRVGFVPLSLKSYVEGLAKMVGHTLPSLSRNFNFADLERVQPDNVRQVVNLARDLDISLREMLVMVRIEMATRLDIAPLPLLLARRRPAMKGANLLTECETTLSQLEADYDTESYAELERLEASIREAYRREEAQSF